jgi:hypothetical protein
MMKSSVAAIAVLMLLSGCAGTRVPKLAKCTGPYRYANMYGTVLPSLPIPGKTMPEVAPATGAAPTGSDPSPKTPATSSGAPDKTGALPTLFPSC